MIKIEEKNKNVFDENLTKIDFRERILIFQSHSNSQNMQNMIVNNMSSILRSEIKKTSAFFIFPAPERNISHDPSIEFDLSCPEHFFWIHCGPYCVPNDFICFQPFFRILVILVDFHFFQAFLLKSD